MMNKKYPTYQFLGFLLIMALFAGCGSSQLLGKSDKQIDYSHMATLADALRVQSGIQVAGTANNIQVAIRGVNSTRSSTGSTFTQSATGSGPVQRQTTSLADVQPLFIVDNTIVGNTYDAAARSVNVQDIVSIKVLKSYAETNSYGETGKNGVILITTKLATTSSR